MKHGTIDPRPARARSALRIASGTIFALVALSGGAFAQDGRLLDSAPVALDEPAIAALEERVPEIRELLAAVELRAITYESDGLKVKGYLAQPKAGGGEAETLPAVIFNRGGNRSFGELNDARAAYLLARVASWGYVVVASQYRGNGGGEGTEEFGGADVDDVLALIPLIESLPRADATRIGMYGWSRGGMMTYLALARTDRIAAAIIGGGLADSVSGIVERPEMEQVYAELVPGYAEHKEEALRARSAILRPEALPETTPILILHGTADWRVDPTQALRMATALYEAKRPFRLAMFEGGDHGLSEYRDEVDRQVKDWLDRYVRDREPGPSLEPHGR